MNSKEVPVRRVEEAVFVWEPQEKRWLKPWDVMRRLHLPGLPRRWRGDGTMSMDDRVYYLVSQEAGAVARWIRFRVSEAGWEILAQGDVLWASNYMELRQYGRRLEGYNPHRRKEPQRTFPKDLLWQVHNIGLKEALVSLPEAPETTYVVAKRDLRFAEAEPTDLEKRLQEIWLLNADVPDRHPLKHSRYLLETGRRYRYVVGADNQIYTYHRFEEWEDQCQVHGLSVDEAILAIEAGLARFPQDGPDDPTFFANRRLIDKWCNGFWTESEVDTIGALRGLYALELDLIAAAMLAVEMHRDFMVHGGSFTLPGLAASAQRGDSTDKGTRGQVP